MCVQFRHRKTLLRGVEAHRKAAKLVCVEAVSGSAVKYEELVGEVLRCYLAPLNKCGSKNGTLTTNILTQGGVGGIIWK